MVVTGRECACAEITKEKLCRTSDFISAKISPDGMLIAKVGADESGIANVTIMPVKGDSSFEQITFFKTPEIIQIFWSGDSKKILLLKDENGTGQLHLHGFDVVSKEHISYSEHLTGVNAKVIKLSPSKNHALVGLNHRNPHFHDLYLLDLDSGGLSLIFQTDTYAKFLVSDDLKVILKMKINEDGSWTVFLENDEIFLSLTSEEAVHTEFISYNSSRKVVYFLDNRFSNTNQITQKSIKGSYKEEVIGGNNVSDIDEIIFIQGVPRAFASYYAQKKWHVLDRDMQKDIDFFTKNMGANFELVSQNQTGSIWIVSCSIPDKGVYFWLYERENTTLSQLSPLESTAPPVEYAKMYDMVVTARDGEQLVCYYTLPKEYDKGGYVDSPIPLVVVPHGGPIKVRDKFEFNSYHQWLASCGYAVLSVNFRFSSGFGKAFVNAGNGQWGGKAHLDVIDAIEACIVKGITEMGKLAVFGASYGGYESLAALTFTPDYFTCCVAICGPSSLKTIIESVPEYWEFTSKPLSDETKFFTKQAFITSMGGDPQDKEGTAYLEKCSPLNYLDEIQAPLLLVHGKNDHVVSERESKQIYEGMKKYGKQVTYILFSNEGHRFGNFANKLMYINQAELFLSKHLNGKYRPSENELIADSTGSIFH